ncbi:MAG: hypothetical protein AAF327_01420 [Cyanobacteria bacterium P01_A01_bin.37]
MEKLTLADIAKYRSALSSHSEAMVALEMIEDCEGDVEDAAIAIALQVGQEPDRTDQWLEGLAKRWRATLCRKGLREDLEQEKLLPVIEALAAETTLPVKLTVPVLICVLQMGLDSFCKPLDESLKNF